MSGVTARARLRQDPADAQERSSILRAHAETLPAPDAEAFADAFERYADARIVLLGESTHGTSEFYRARAAITRRLIERHGFTIVAVEADWPDAARVDRHVRHRRADPGRAAAFARFPTWMWRNAEVLAFVDWLREWNAAHDAGARAEFRGLDVYSLRASIGAVLDYLGRVDPAAAAAARERYGCLTPWQAEPARYGREVLYGRLADCEAQVVAQLRAMLERRLQDAAQDGEELFDAAQNARVVRAAEQYYRVMYRGAAESWNLRDRHMFDTLQRLLGRRRRGKAVVWAHNSHIGDARATAMGWGGELNVGELARTAYGDGAVLVGFGTDRGTVAAAHDWDEPMEIMSVRPALDGSWERAFRETRASPSLTDWRGRDGELRTVLGETNLERAIGVVYRPDTERASHYFEARLADQFDAWVWFERSSAVTALGRERPGDAPDTWPFGL